MKLKFYCYKIITFRFSGLAIGIQSIYHFVAYEVSKKTWHNFIRFRDLWIFTQFWVLTKSHQNLCSLLSGFETVTSERNDGLDSLEKGKVGTKKTSQGARLSLSSRLPGQSSPPPVANYLQGALAWGPLDPPVQCIAGIYVVFPISA